MTKNWLVEVAPAVKTAAKEVVVEPVSKTPHLDNLIEKLGMAEDMGRSLARSDPDLLEKEALALGPAAMGLGRTAAATMMRNPTKALAAGGAAAGGLMGAMKTPGYDGQGQPQSRLGNMTRGALGGAGLGYAASQFKPIQAFTKGQGVDLSRAIRSTTPKVKIASMPSALGQAGRKVLGLAARHPTAALTAGGAAAGAIAGGPEHRLSGAAIGAGVGAGASKIPQVSKFMQQGASAAPAAAIPKAIAPATQATAISNPSRTLGGMGKAPAMPPPIPADARRPTMSTSIAPAAPGAAPLQTSGGTRQINPSSVGNPQLSKATNPELRQARPHYEGDSAQEAMAEWGAGSPEHAAVVDRYNTGRGVGSAVGPTDPTVLAKARGGTVPGVGGIPRRVATQTQNPLQVNAA